MLYRIACAATLAAACASAVQAAPVSAITFTTIETSTTAVHSTRGYAFDVTAPGLLATHLSVWDFGGDGLAEAHTVGLWSPSGTLLASVLVPAGTSASLLDGFRYVDIADVALDVGTGYVVGATFLEGSGDQQAGTLLGLASAPGLAYAEGRYANDTQAGALTLPLTAFVGLPGGSLLVDTGTLAVPAPGSVALAGLGLLLAGWTRMRQPRR
jgi:Domain of unknown function (DUF4082)